MAQLALLLGATFPKINAVAAWVPSEVVFWALGLAESGDTRPRGLDVPRSGVAVPLGELCERRSAAGAPARPRGRLHAVLPRQLRDTRAVERVEGLQDDLLFQGGTAKADAEAGVDAWRDLWPSSTKRRRRTGHEARLSRYGCCTDLQL